MQIYNSNWKAHKAEIFFAIKLSTKYDLLLDSSLSHFGICQFLASCPPCYGCLWSY